MSQIRTSHERIVDHLRKRIAAGTLRRGDRLPSFEQLHRQFGVTSHTVMKALTVLERDGLVDRRERSGVYVSHAASLKRANRIAVLGGSLQTFETDYWTRMSAGAQSAARETGSELTYFASHDSLSSGQYDGVMTFESDAIAIPDASLCSIPTVIAVSRVAGFPAVCVNEFDAGYLAARYLADMGHVRIGFLGWLDTYSGLVRLAGYHAGRHVMTEEELQEYHAGFQIAVPAHDYRLVREMAYPRNPDHLKMQYTSQLARMGYKSMAQWSAHGFDDLGCTALIVHSDYYAQGVMEWLQEHGYRVPQDISIIGFDNERDCSTMNPALTSVGADMFLVGKRAVHMLVEMIGGGKQESALISPSLYVRESTAPPPDK